MKKSKIKRLRVPGFGRLEEARLSFYKSTDERRMPIDMLDRLILDPGTNTLGELLQEGRNEGRRYRVPQVVMRTARKRLTTDLKSSARSTFVSRRALCTAVGVIQ